MTKGDEIAIRINKRLKWLEENDNPVQAKSGGSALPYFWRARAYRAGPKISITYIDYKGPIYLTLNEAERYADYLDNGGTKTHSALTRSS